MAKVKTALLIFLAACDVPPPALDVFRDCVGAVDGVVGYKLAEQPTRYCDLEATRTEDGRVLLVGQLRDSLMANFAWSFVVPDLASLPVGAAVSLAGSNIEMSVANGVGHFCSRLDGGMVRLLYDAPVQRDSYLRIDAADVEMDCGDEHRVFVGSVTFRILEVW